MELGHGRKTVPIEKGLKGLSNDHCRRIELRADLEWSGEVFRTRDWGPKAAHSSLLRLLR